MSRPRSEFKAALDGIDGVAAVYGQEPTNTVLEYPCIIFKDDNEHVKRADNVPYNITDRYSVTAIDNDPNRPIAKAIREAFAMCTFNRRYETDNLIHTVYYIYF